MSCSPSAVSQLTVPCTADISALFSALQQHDELAYMSLLDLTRFVRRTHLLKDDILQPQPHTVPTTMAPDVLPPAITTFLSQSFSLSLRAVDHLWEIVKDLAWTLPSVAEELADDELAFEVHGHELGLSETRLPISHSQ